nr:SRPBCC domain-containing protein [uncultured Flavobacterium sp.]
MKKVQFTTRINAPKERVWQVLWDDPTYREWTSVFSEGSKAISDWQEGSKIHFLNENNDGMYSTIDKRIDNEIMNFKHIGNVKNGEELPVVGTTESWSGSTENYTLSEAGGSTILTVEMDIVPDYLDFFNEKFPQAFEKIKTLSEA